MRQVAVIPKNRLEEIRVSIDVYMGYHLCNIRIWYSDGDTMRPGRQGLAVRVDRLPELVAALQEAAAVARMGGE